MPKVVLDDLPEHLHEVLKAANEHVALGARVWFKFTCGKCGARQTFEEPNAFYKDGECEDCKHVTSLLDPKANVNFLMMAASPDKQEELHQIFPVKDE